MPEKLMITLNYVQAPNLGQKYWKRPPGSYSHIRKYKLDFPQKTVSDQRSSLFFNHKSKREKSFKILTQIRRKRKQRQKVIIQQTLSSSKLQSCPIGAMTFSQMTICQKNNWPRKSRGTIQLMYRHFKLHQPIQNISVYMQEQTNVRPSNGIVQLYFLGQLSFCRLTFDKLSWHWQYKTNVLRKKQFIV